MKWLNNYNVLLSISKALEITSIGDFVGPTAARGEASCDACQAEIWYCVVLISEGDTVVSELASWRMRE